jgi:hypothetical protein
MTIDFDARWTCGFGHGQFYTISFVHNNFCTKAPIEMFLREIHIFILVRIQGRLIWMKVESADLKICAISYSSGVGMKIWSEVLCHIIIRLIVTPVGWGTTNAVKSASTKRV